MKTWYSLGTRFPGTERTDVLNAGACDSADVGFVAIWNWGNLGGDGTYTAIVYDNAVEFARSTFTATTLERHLWRGRAASALLRIFRPLGRVRGLRGMRTRAGSWLIRALQGTNELGPWTTWLRCSIMTQRLSQITRSRDVYLPPPPDRSRAARRSRPTPDRRGG